MLYVYGDGLSQLLHGAIYDYDDCFFPHVAIILSCLLKLSNKCACEYLIFFGYDVRFVDVVKFDYRNFWFL